MSRILTGIGFVACATAFAMANRVDLNIFENPGPVDPGTVDLWVDVLDMGSTVDFVFHNDSTDGVISNVYFEQNALIANGAITGSTGAVAFAVGGSPANPAGSIVGFGGTWDGNLFRVSANSPSPANGVGVGETLTISFDLVGTYAQVLAALQPDATEGFRIVEHAISFGPYSLWTTNVPTPGAAAILGFGGLLAARRRR